MNKIDKPTEVKIENPIISQIGGLLKKTAKWVFVIIAIMVLVVLLFFAIRAVIQGIIRKQHEITQAKGTV